MSADFHISYLIFKFFIHYIDLIAYTKKHFSKIKLIYKKLRLQVPPIVSYFWINQFFNRFRIKLNIYLLCGR